MSAQAVAVVAEHWAPASPRTASIFVGVHIGDGTVDQTRSHWAPPAEAVDDMPRHTPPGASWSAGDYNLLVERFLYIKCIRGRQRKEFAIRKCFHFFSVLALGIIYSNTGYKTEGENRKGRKDGCSILVQLDIYRVGLIRRRLRKTADRDSLV